MAKLALSERILMNIEKPARYIGNEVNIVKKDLANVDIRIAMCFPDVYEIGMSYLDIQILYDMFNRREDTYCERVYSPWPDLDRIMREENIPLFSLETQTPIHDMDILAITIQYEMCYTNILQVIDLSNISIFSKDRTEDDPIVIGGLKKNTISHDYFLKGSLTFNRTHNISNTISENGMKFTCPELSMYDYKK